MRAEPADTQAPEKFFPFGLDQLRQISQEKLGFVMLREHETIPELLPKIHRFRAHDKAGLYALAKDVARLTADSIDTAAIQTLVRPPKDTKWGSLKSLENLIALRMGPKTAREMMASLVGTYELRQGDAHLPSSDLDDAFELVGVNQEAPTVYQGYQMLHACVSSIFGLIETLERWD